jgi:hypothetical protein
MNSRLQIKGHVPGIYLYVLNSADIFWNYSKLVVKNMPALGNLITNYFQSDDV